MDLKMKSYTDAELYPMKEPMAYTRICVACAAKLGGKPDMWTKSGWHVAVCEGCGKKREVAGAKYFIWR